MISLLDEALPQPRLREVERIAVATDPAATWAAARTIDLYRLRFVRGLFAMRVMPDQLSTWLHGNAIQKTPQSMRIDDIVAQGSGFHRLGERPGREVVVGAIGKVWKPKIPFVDVDSAEAFAAFREPGFAKVAWNVEVVPRVGGGSWVSVELRVAATDEDAWRRFSRYWLLIGRFSRLIRVGVLRMLARDLGRATRDADRALPGDDLLPSAGASWTDAITIEAPVRDVWPWLVQMGCRRAGWYSIDRLDNGGARSADRIIPELQHIRVGDRLPATPTDEGGFAVLHVDAPRVLVLGSPGLLADPPADARWGMLGARYESTWTFMLDPIGDAATRLVVRARGAMEPGVRSAVTKAALHPMHAVMERSQLHHIKERVERA
jgi:hypothetical protein